MKTSDILVIGGGVIGTAVAYGLAELGAQVNLLDQGGSTPNASRGNFGLVWVKKNFLCVKRKWNNCGRSPQTAVLLLRKTLPAKCWTA